ncbi:energy transducer TonB [Desulfovibrio inopinatus]|uniref:energy transducer TonB n=1 Tax=Desulfovibrio inopinatus TaxID=102109 RepID=UPI0004801292|nr:energy transducer TonB [Desulfovibrio inopinatus]
MSLYLASRRGAGLSSLATWSVWTVSILAHALAIISMAALAGPKPLPPVLPRIVLTASLGMPGYGSGAASPDIAVGPPDVPQKSNEPEPPLEKEMAQAPEPTPMPPPEELLQEQPAEPQQKPLETLDAQEIEPTPVPPPLKEKAAVKPKPKPKKIKHTPPVKETSHKKKKANTVKKHKAKSQTTKTASQTAPVKSNATSSTSGGSKTPSGGRGTPGGGGNLGSTGSPLQASQLDRQPALVFAPQPEYPLKAKRRGLRTKLRVRLLVDKGGHVKRVDILGGEYADIFSTNVRRALARWRFKPGTLKGKPVNWVAVLPVAFELR